ncbi:hypothetical protein [Bullifex sp.]|uniref:hypothetical protein n=1 Tax=Bullifex sp. TaxID=2815808 RepID=UPI002A83BB84|nr:hypothetical protein [Bullifex sp.]MDY4067163.1 hypothetical protein [Bullifex sp.]
MNEEFNFEEYQNEIHRTGKTMLSIGVIMLLSCPFIMAYVTGSTIEWPAFFKAIVSVLIVYVPSCIVEYLIYVPLLGSGASYLTFLTGNITNLKLPCAFNSRDMAGAKVGSTENEIISTLSVATSSLVTMLVIFIGVLLLIPLTPILQNPVIKPAFDNVLPALFGALGYQYFKKSIKITVFPLSFMVLLCLIVPSMINQTSFLLIACGAIAIGLSYVFFKKGMLK